MSYTDDLEAERYIAELALQRTKEIEQHCAELLTELVDELFADPKELPYEDALRRKWAITSLSNRLQDHVKGNHGAIAYILKRKVEYMDYNRKIEMLMYNGASDSGIMRREIDEYLEKRRRNGGHDFIP